MSNNPFDPIYRACNAGNSKTKLQNLPPFPRLVDIELTNTCNFRCLMCPTGTFSVKRPKGFMDKELYLKILDQLAPWGTAVRFIRWGEPLLHPEVLDFIAAARSRGLLTHINTNGSKLSDELIEALCAIPLDSLKFSFQGIDAKSYGEMRNTDFFDSLVDIIRHFRDIRGDRPLPYLHVSTSTTYETPEQILAFRSLLEALVDKVTVGKTVLEHLDINEVRLRPDETRELERLIKLQTVTREHPECPEVYDKLSIDWDGTITACCGDSDRKMMLGNVREQTLEEIWHSDRLHTYRVMLADMRHDEIDLCSTCYTYAELTKPPAEDE